MEINRRKLDQIAEEVVGAFKKGTDPSKAIKEVSKLYDFNIEQVRRLCETANVKIKQMLIESGDPNPTFPLADWEEIMVDVETNDIIEGTKMAHALFLDDFDGDKELFNEMSYRDIVKTASSPGITPKSISSLLIDIDIADRRLKSTRNKVSHLLEKKANEILDHLHQEEMKCGNLDLSYTIAKKVVFNFDRGAVDGLFKIARDTFERNFEQPVEVPKITKIAGVINYNSKFCNDIRDYAKARSQMLKVALAESKIGKARKKLIKTFGGLLSESS